MPEEIKKNPWIWIAGIAAIVLICGLLILLVMFALTVVFTDVSDATAMHLMLTA